MDEPFFPEDLMSVDLVKEIRERIKECLGRDYDPASLLGRGLVFEPLERTLFKVELTVIRSISLKGDSLCFGTRYNGDIECIEWDIKQRTWTATCNNFQMQIPGLAKLYD